MRVLLDTQTLIWFLLDAPELRNHPRGIITGPANSVYVSHISFFEIAIKQKIGKLPGLTAPVSKLISLAHGDNLIILPISEKHLAAYERIPLLPDHRDPFDRLLLATAFAEEMPIVSTDKQFPQYAPLVTVIAG